MAGSATRPTTTISSTALATHTPPAPISPAQGSTGSSALNPSVHWFKAWNGSAVAESPANAFSDVSAYNGAVQPDAPTTKTDVKSKKNPTTAHAPALASVDPAATNHVQMKIGGFSYVFADFEANQALSKLNPDAAAAQTHGWSIFTSPAYREFESTLPNAFENNESPPGNSLFLTKAQYEILRVGRGNALYPGAISILDKSSDGNLHRGVQEHFLVVDGRLAAPLSDSKNLTLRGEERLYHHGVPWTAALNDLMSISLTSGHRSPGAHKLPAVMGFAQLGGNTTQAVALCAVADQIAYYRLRGAFAANAFEQGMTDDDGAEQGVYNDDSGTGASSESDRAANRAKARAKQTLLAFNPTMDTTSKSESQSSQDVSASIWSGSYLLKADHAQAAGGASGLFVRCSGRLSHGGRV